MSWVGNEYCEMVSFCLGSFSSYWFLNHTYLNIVAISIFQCHLFTFINNVVGTCRRRVFPSEFETNKCKSDITFGFGFVFVYISCCDNLSTGIWIKIIAIQFSDLWFTLQMRPSFRHHIDLIKSNVMWCDVSRIYYRISLIRLPLIVQLQIISALK